jgi:hypothetical protein
MGHPKIQFPGLNDLGTNRQRMLETGEPDGEFRLSTADPEMGYELEAVRSFAPVSANIRR